MDEAGDTGLDIDNGSSLYFLIGFVYFPDDNCTTCMQTIRKVIKDKYGKVYADLKAADCNNATREIVLKQLVEHNVKCGYFYVNKQEEQIQQYFREDENIFLTYKELICSQLGYLIRNEEISSISVHIDPLSQLKGGEGRKGKGKGRDDPKKRLKRHVFNYVRGVLGVKNLGVKNLGVIYIPSRASDGVQCADFVSWSARRALEREPDFYNIIKDRVIFVDKFEVKSK